ncbi:hypothetical protein DYB32_001383 [Aphanomyces invadans]|uniref:EF-hand domain-containing protein n=1 Tax=Aphanomyces invadans TaxID=157072 RepID=A0A418B6P8_9STRA|nr:hypothetical protein DYB32_001383 [Aphanomyces invadans]
MFELMRTADTNDDGRLDFKEFFSRFDVIFTDVRLANSQSFISPPPAPTSLSAPSKLVRKKSERAAPLTPAPKVRPPATYTMAALVAIGRAFFQLEGTLLDNFHRFDTNRDGVLQKDEFFQALRHLNLNYPDELLAKIMEAVDLDGGNTIDYKEFLAAFTVKDASEQVALEKGDMTWQQSVLQQVSNMFYQHRIHIRAAFRLFDVDNSGTISIDEFRTGIATFNAIMDSPLTDEQIDALLAHLDSDSDGIISYKEFLEGFQVVDVRLHE